MVFDLKFDGFFIEEIFFLELDFTDVDIKGEKVEVEVVNIVPLASLCGFWGGFISYLLIEDCDFSDLKI